MFSTRASGESSLAMSSRALSNSPLVSTDSTLAHVRRLRTPIFASVT